MNQRSFWLALVSIFLYSALAIVSYMYYRKFKFGNGENQPDLGKFHSAKVTFFQILATSAALDVPLFIACIAVGCPKQCEWGTTSFPIVWCMHYVAVCGYAFAVVIPPILWSDIINHKDGALWFSKFPLDWTKRFFQVALILYSITTFLDILAIIIYFRNSDYLGFNSTPMYKVTSLAEPLLIFFITGGSLWCGIKLLLYVRKVKLGTSNEVKILIRLNITMLIIWTSYTARSVMAISNSALLFDRPSWYFDYTIWILMNRWLPYIFCSFCLIREMSFTGRRSVLVLYLFRVNTVKFDVNFISIFVLFGIGIVFYELIVNYFVAHVMIGTRLEQPILNSNDTPNSEDKDGTGLNTPRFIRVASRGGRGGSERVRLLSSHNRKSSEDSSSTSTGQERSGESGSSGMIRVRDGTGYDRSTPASSTSVRNARSTRQGLLRTALLGQFNAAAGGGDSGGSGAAGSRGGADASVGHHSIVGGSTAYHSHPMPHHYTTPLHDDTSSIHNEDNSLSYRMQHGSDDYTMSNMTAEHLDFFLPPNMEHGSTQNSMSMRFSVNEK